VISELQGGGSHAKPRRNGGGGLFPSTSTSTVRQGGLSTSTRGLVSGRLGGWVSREAAKARRETQWTVFGVRSGFRG
jgi:hypothetical protein